MNLRNDFFDELKNSKNWIFRKINKSRLMFINNKSEDLYRKELSKFLASNQMEMKVNESLSWIAYESYSMSHTVGLEINKKNLFWFVFDIFKQGMPRGLHLNQAESSRTTPSHFSPKWTIVDLSFVLENIRKKIKNEWKNWEMNRHCSLDVYCTFSKARICDHVRKCIFIIQNESRAILKTASLVLIIVLTQLLVSELKNESVIVWYVIQSCAY